MTTGIDWMKDSFGTIQEKLLDHIANVRLAELSRTDLGNIGATAQTISVFLGVADGLERDAVRFMKQEGFDMPEMSCYPANKLEDVVWNIHFVKHAPKE